MGGVVAKATYGCAYPDFELKDLRGITYLAIEHPTIPRTHTFFFFDLKAISNTDLFVKVILMRIEPQSIPFNIVHTLVLGLSVFRGWCIK